MCESRKFIETNFIVCTVQRITFRTTVIESHHKNEILPFTNKIALKSQTSEEKESNVSSFDRTSFVREMPRLWI